MPSDLLDQLQETLSPTYTVERELGGGGMSRVRNPAIEWTIGLRKRSSPAPRLDE